MKIVETADAPGSIRDQGEMPYVLVVSSTFPSGGGSRIDKFVKLLPEFGFQPIVLTTANNGSVDSEVLPTSLYPPAPDVYRARLFGWSYFTERYLDRGPERKYYTLLKWLSFPERCLFVPDYMVRWVPHGVYLSRKIVKMYQIRYVFTSSPPESTHLIGLYLKKRYGLRWIADFRDLWTETPMLYRPATPLHDRLIRRLEKYIFCYADHIIANTPDNYEHYRNRFDLPENRLTLITNGYDRDDLEVVDEKTERQSDRFTVGHMGNFDKQNYPWRLFLEAFKMLADEVGWDKVQFIHCGFYSRDVVSTRNTATRQIDQKTGKIHILLCRSHYCQYA